MSIKFINPSTPPACVKAFSLPPPYPDQIQFQPPTLPQNWGDKGAEGKQKIAAQMTAWITMIFDHNNPFGNSLHDIQKVSLRIFITQGVLPLVPIQHNTPRHRVHGYFRRSCKLGFSGSHVGAFRIRGSTPISIADHRLPPRV